MESKEKKREPNKLAASAGERKPRPNKIEQSGAEEAVNEVLLNGGTLEEASEKFRDITGEGISLDAVSRHRIRLSYHYAKLEKLELLVDNLLNRAADLPHSEPGDVVRQMLLALTLEAAEKLSPEALLGIPPDQLSMVVARLENAKTQRERVRLDYIRTAMEAKQGIIAEMKQELRDNPELRVVMRMMDEEAVEQDRFG